ncbi:MAG TPA: beta galactosidase jelly roll domain-containing protein [Terriglobales bacterium]|nr:beta galactosidase jelly roll domain-containing protein [Terriglobales bacterium]
MTIRRLSLFLLALASTAFAFQNPQVPDRISLERNWHIQSACKVSDSGDAISRAEYKVQGWLATSVPHTVLGAQVDARLFPDPFFAMNLRAIPGTTYPIGKLFSDLPMPDDSPYHCSWWYRTEFHVGPRHQGKNVWLHLDGINYRANIWVNGKQIATADQVAGAYRTYEFNVKDAVHPGAVNALAVEVSAQSVTDLGINFVDWNPAPADKAMGLWRPVYITLSGPVSVRHPMVSTHFPDDSLKTAELTVTAELQNAGAEQVSGTVEAVLEGIGTVQQQVTLAPNARQTVVFTADKFPQLRAQNPKVWWPYPLGAQSLYTVSMRFQMQLGNNAGHPSSETEPRDDKLTRSQIGTSRRGSFTTETPAPLSSASNALSDTATAKFGIREVTAEKNQSGYELFRVNHRTILIRGGGWSPDMFLRVNNERLENELRHVRNLGLNTIRLEGKLETDEFFDLTDRYGILVMAGWCCCDHWEHWDKWQPADHEIAKASLASQISRLRSHASMLVWLNGSDNPPLPDVESDYIAVLKQYAWPNPFISSASATPTTITGPSGVKMSGPYDYVPPSYWLRDPGRWGGAYGFNTETSPGPAPPLISSLEKFIPKQNLWPHDDVWNFHAGGGSFTQTNIFDNAMSVTYGPPLSAADYEKKAQAMTYDGERAMFEAYARNKYNSTGVIQWMLNNAWPSVIWHLYDYYLVPGGGYFGAKKANEVVHAQYSFDDRSVVVVNSLYEPQKGLKLRVRVLDMASRERFADLKSVDLDPDSVARVLTIPDISSLSTPYFVRLDLTDAAGKTLSSNFYWLPTALEDLDWEQSNYFTTPARYADMTALASLPAANVEWSSLAERRGEEQLVRVTLHNASRNLAFMVHTELKHGRSGDDIAPVLWDDNYISLLPGESRTLTATVRVRDLGVPAATVKVNGWNVRSVAK